MPTFNDLYDVWLGNPTLQPEHSESYDIGFETLLDQSGIHSVEMTYFDILTKDRILPNAFYFPENIPQAQSTGIEARYDLRLLQDGVNAFADLTFNEASRQSTDSTNGKQLMYIPKAVYSLGITARLLGFSFSLSEMYTSKRFMAADESAWLPEYWLTNVNLTTVLPLHSFRVDVRAEVSNLFDRDYQVLPGYPMPGRTFKFVLGVDY
jgi:outer membrane cobalamin receptor